MCAKAERIAAENKDDEVCGIAKQQPKQTPAFPPVSWNSNPFTSRRFLASDELVLELAIPRRRAEYNTGTDLWPAGKHFTRWLAQGNVSLLGRHCIELGAGLGVAGLCAACLGAHVLLTDLPENLPTLHENCRRNAARITQWHGSASVAELDWVAVARGGEAQDTASRLPGAIWGGPVDVVLGTDVSWNPELCSALLATIMVLLSTREAQTADAFFAHTPRHPLIGEGGSFETLEGEVGFPLALPLQEAGFCLADEVRIGDARGTCILHYVRKCEASEEAFPDRS